MSVNNFIKTIELNYPLALQEPWDNSGWQVKLPFKTNSVIAALSPSLNVVKEAISKNSSLIISHHPLFFKPVKSIKTSNPESDIIISLIKNNISLYSLHTPVDSAENGIADYWADILELSQKTAVAPILSPSNDKLEKNEGIGRQGVLEAHKSVEEIKEILNKNGISYFQTGGKLFNRYEKIYVVPGSGRSLLSKAEERSLFISSDLGYHDAEFAYRNNFTILNTSHFEIESVFRTIMERVNKSLDDRVEFLHSSEDKDYYIF